MRVESIKNSAVFTDVSWDYYSRTLAEIGPSRATRVTFDSGVMEIFKTNPWHERVKCAIAGLIDVYAVNANIPVTGLGCLTLRREDLGKGLEPDDCYYVSTPPPRPTLDDFDLTKHPLPDLGIEVGISVGAVPRLPVYAALGVRELWRCEAGNVVVLQLAPGGQYVTAQRSLAFPDLLMAKFSEYLATDLNGKHLDALRAMQSWAREHQRS